MLAGSKPQYQKKMQKARLPKIFKNSVYNLKTSEVEVGWMCCDWRLIEETIKIEKKSR